MKLSPSKISTFIFYRLKLKVIMEVLREIMSSHLDIMESIAMR